MRTTYVNELPIVEIDNFLSDIEVDKLLNTRINSFTKASSHYPEYYRNNDRLVEDNQVLGKELFSKMQQFKELRNVFPNQLNGLNERLRLCRYQKNQAFNKHQDGVYYPNEYLESKYTFLLYLNGIEDFSGGETLFYTAKSDEIPVKSITPKKGTLVVFDHRIWHQGAIITEGNKYILRSDVFVNRNKHATHHDGYIWSLLKLNEQQFISCGRDTKVKVWNKQLQLQNVFKPHSKSVLKIVQLSNNEFISCSRDFTLKKWGLNGAILDSIVLNEMILSIKVNQVTQMLFAVGTSGTLYIFDYKLQLQKSIIVHDNWIWDVAIHPNGIIITCGEDGTIKITNIVTKDVKCLYRGTEPIFCLHIKENGTLYAGSKSGTLIKIDIVSQKTSKTKLHNDSIRSIITQHENVLTCAEDNSVKSYNFKTNQKSIIAKSDNFIQDIICLGNTIYSAGFDGLINTNRLN